MSIQEHCENFHVAYKFNIQLSSIKCILKIKALSIGKCVFKVFILLIHFVCVRACVYVSVCVGTHVYMCVCVCLCRPEEDLGTLGTVVVTEC